MSSTGIDFLKSLDWDELGKKVLSTNLAGFFANPVAEGALTGILSFYQCMDQLILNQVAEKWDTMRIRSQKRLLRDTRVLLCGYGAIGKKNEKRLGESI